MGVERYLCAKYVQVTAKGCALGSKLKTATDLLDFRNNIVISVGIHFVFHGALQLERSVALTFGALQRKQRVDPWTDPLVQRALEDNVAETAYR